MTMAMLLTFGERMAVGRVRRVALAFARFTLRYIVRRRWRQNRRGDAVSREVMDYFLHIPYPCQALSAVNNSVKSGGNGASKLTYSLVRGWRKPSRSAWRN